MSAKDIVDTILKHDEDAFVTKLESAIVAPKKTPESALAYIVSKTKNMRDTFFTNKNVNKDDIMAVDLTKAIVDFASLRAWLTATGVTQMAEAFDVYNSMDPSGTFALILEGAINDASIKSIPDDTLNATLMTIQTASAPTPTAPTPSPTPAAPSSGLTDLGLSPADLKSLVDALDHLDAYEAYDAETAAIRRAKPSEFLVITPAIATKARALALERVGKFSIPLSDIEKLQILHLNATRLGGAPNHWKIAMVRVFLIEHGYLKLDDKNTQMHVTNNEVIIATAVPSTADLKIAAAWFIGTENAAFRDNAKILGSLAPIMASDVFLRTGHHYLDGKNYDENYARLFDAATVPHLKGVMPNEDLFHIAIHWIGPAAMRLAWSNLLGSVSLPNTFNTRYYAAPAGCAVITTTKAVLDAISTLGCFADVKEVYDDSVKAIMAMDPIIKKDPTKFFDLGYLYGKAPLTPVEKEELERSKLHAIRLSAVCKAFLTTIAKNTQLAKSKVLNKHASQNVGTQNIAESWFKAYFNRTGLAPTLRSALGM